MLATFIIILGQRWERQIKIIVLTYESQEPGSHEKMLDQEDCFYKEFYCYLTFVSTSVDVFFNHFYIRVFISLILFSSVFKKSQYYYYLCTNI